MVIIILRQKERAADYVRAVKPFCRGQLLLAELFNHMLRHGVQIPCIGIFKGGQSHGIFGGKLNGFVIDHLNPLHALRSFFHKALVSHSFKGIQHQSSVIHYRAGQAAHCVLHILRRHRGSVRPCSRVVNVYDKIKIILCGDGICQHILEIQILIQLHQGKKHQPDRILINLCLINHKRIDPSKRVRNAHIYNFASL